MENSFNFFFYSFWPKLILNKFVIIVKNLYEKFYVTLYELVYISPRIARRRMRLQKKAVCILLVHNNILFMPILRCNVHKVCATKVQSIRGLLCSRKLCQLPVRLKRCKAIIFSEKKNDYQRRAYFVFATVQSISGCQSIALYMIYFIYNIIRVLMAIEILGLLFSF